MTTNMKRKVDFIIPSSIDLHCEIQTVPFAQLSQMQPGEPSAIETWIEVNGQSEGYK